MKNFRFFFKFTCKLLVIFFLLIGLIDLYFRIFPSQNFFITRTVKDRDELFDEDLVRYNTIKKLEARVDSEYASLTEEKHLGNSIFPRLLSSIVRRRFYHGYAAYNMGNNFLASFAGKLTNRTYDAIVRGDDILKFEEADCRQQCLVMMEILKGKGYPVRGVHMDSRKYDRAHYTFETFYQGSWHFYDPDLEPDADLLLEKSRPSLYTLVNDSLLLPSIYRKQDAGMIISLFRSYHYDKENVLIPPHLYLFHDITKFLSNWAWLICLAILFYPTWSPVFKKQSVFNNEFLRKQQVTSRSKISSPA